MLLSRRLHRMIRQAVWVGLQARWVEIVMDRMMCILLKSWIIIGQWQWLRSQLLTHLLYKCCFKRQENRTWYPSMSSPSMSLHRRRSGMIGNLLGIFRLLKLWRFMNRQTGVLMLVCLLLIHGCFNQWKVLISRSSREKQWNESDGWNTRGVSLVTVIEFSVLEFVALRFVFIYITLLCCCFHLFSTIVLWMLVAVPMMIVVGGLSPSSLVFHVCELPNVVSRFLGESSSKWILAASLCFSLFVCHREYIYTLHGLSKGFVVVLPTAILDITTKRLDRP